jgi:hypothetical protein
VSERSCERGGWPGGLVVCACMVLASSKHMLPSHHLSLPASLLFPLTTAPLYHLCRSSLLLLASFTSSHVLGTMRVEVCKTSPSISADGQHVPDRVDLSLPSPDHRTALPTLAITDTRGTPTCGDRARRRGHGHVDYLTNTVWSLPSVCRPLHGTSPPQ